MLLHIIWDPHYQLSDIMSYLDDCLKISPFCISCKRFIVPYWNLFLYVPFMTISSFEMVYLSKPNDDIGLFFLNTMVVVPSLSSTPMVYLQYLYLFDSKWCGRDIMLLDIHGVTFELIFLNSIVVLERYRSMSHGMNLVVCCTI